MRVIFSILLLAACTVFGSDVPIEDEIATYGGAYFAPMSSFGFWRMRMPDGVIREFFQPSHWKSGEICSADGWTGQLRGKGVTVIKMPKGSKPRLEWVFEYGTLRLVAVNGVGYGLDYAQPIVYDGARITRLWPDRRELTKKDVRVKSTWSRRKSKRLFAWFSSPNKAGAFFCFLALVSFGVAWQLKRVWLRLVATLSGVGFLAATLLTGSRGAVLAFVVSLCIVSCAIAISKGVRIRYLAFVGLVLAVVTGMVFVYLLHGGGIRSEKAARGSDRTRSAVFQVAPRMFRDAPQGWGSRYVHVGAAYTNWYQAQKSKDRQVRLNLISDHLTRLVQYGWVKGWIYAAGWLVILSVLFMLACYGFSPIPLAVWTSYAIVPFFNLIFGEGLWIVPVLSLAFLLPGRPWRHVKPVLCGVGGGMIGAFIFVGVLIALSGIIPWKGPNIHKDGPRVLIGNSHPMHWVVDDREVLGGISTGRDICRHFQRNPESPAIGYVQSIDDLPIDGSVRHLTLAGASGRAYLQRVADQQYAGKMPETIRFLSPAFAPSEIPETLRGKVAIAVIVGEFAARYNREYLDKPRWVSVVKGAEVYLPRWVEYVVK